MTWELRNKVKGFQKSKQDIKMANPRNIVLIPFPPQGHLTPMIQLATILHSNGFSITIAHTQFKSPDPTNHPNFNFLTIPDELTKSIVSSMDPIALIRLINDNLEVKLLRLLGSVESEKQRIGCVIYDCFMYKTESVANRLKIPSVVLRSSSCTLSVVDSLFPSFVAEGILPLKDSIRDDLIPGLEPVRYRDLPDLDYPNLDDLLQLVKDTSDLRTSSAIIWNTTTCLEEPSLSKIHRILQVPYFAIGPLHKIAPSTAISTSLLKENTDCISWLDQKLEKSVIYVSFGSTAKIDEKGLIELAWGLVNSGVCFLLVVRANTEWKNDGSMPAESIIKEHGCIVDWAPQKEVLGHSATGGFLSHCGWNSILESVSEGVPMICKPCFGEQKLNARYVSDVWKVGITLENDEMERNEIEKTVRRLMVEEEGEEIQRRAGEYAAKIEQALGSNGCFGKALNDLVEFLVAL